MPSLLVLDFPSGEPPNPGGAFPRLSPPGNRAPLIYLCSAGWQRRDSSGCRFRPLWPCSGKGWTPPRSLSYSRLPKPNCSAVPPSQGEKSPVSTVPKAAAAAFILSPLRQKSVTCWPARPIKEACGGGGRATPSTASILGKF